MIAEILCSMMLLTNGDTLVTDSISRAPSDAKCSVELTVDYPTAGPEALVDSVRAYIATEVKSFYMARLDGDGSPRPADYSGDLKDGKALVDFHSEHILADMQDIYRSLTKDYGGTEMYMTDQGHIRRTSENDSIVSYEAGCYQYEGGAHGLYWIEGTTFRKSDGKRIVINLDLSKVDAMQPLLREGLATYLRDNGAETTIDDLLKSDTFISDGQIPLPSTNPYLTADGVKFVYQEYEIGPYAIGTPTFTIPLKDIQPFIDNSEE
ncbi:RsiV family protein [uncultured Prevotella sp.]|uniref:RsiV family protein n=1 Tax=uncultured Prevotella sp. TaxID=159272 RepID=UPI002582875A|nr:RsiV family protein [uncultured Prevotella sp.]